MFDTNIFVRSLIGSHVNRALYNLFEEGTVKIVLSDKMFKELVDVLYRPELSLNEKDIKHCLYMVKDKAKIVIPKQIINDCRDIKDNMVLETAIESNATYIVSNDEDILSLKPSYRGTSIVTPAEFVRVLHGKP